MTAIAVPMPPASNKYLQLAYAGLRQRLGERSLLVARATFYVLVLFIFSRLWAKVSSDAPGNVWYLAVTEWVLLSQPRLFVDIERDIRGGEIAYRLTRPSNYLGERLAEGASEMALSMLVLGVVGFVAAFALTGAPPHHGAGLPAALVLGIVAGVLLLLCNALIGVSAFWLQDCSPAYWLWQKLLFVLGGLFVPLALYPEWLRVLALWLPFSAMISGPAGLLLEPNGTMFGLQLLKLLSCIVLVLHALDATYSRALERLEIHGG